MKKKQQAAPEYFTDNSDRHLVRIALANTEQRATMYAEDFHRWLAAGFSPFLSLTSTGGRHKYVLANVRSPRNTLRSLPLARWIAGAGRGERVRYADGDRLNLRRENLVIVKGGGSAKAAVAWLRPNDGTTPLRKCQRAASCSLGRCVVDAEAPQLALSYQRPARPAGCACGQSARP